MKGDFQELMASQATLLSFIVSYAIRTDIAIMVASLQTISGCVRAISQKLLRFLGCLYTAVWIKVVQKRVKVYTTMPKGSLGNTQ